MRSATPSSLASRLFVLSIAALFAGCPGPGPGDPGGGGWGDDDSPGDDDSTGADDDASTGDDDDSTGDDDDSTGDDDDSTGDDDDTGGGCSPTDPGGGMPALSAPDFTAAVSAPEPIFRTLTDHGLQYYPDGQVTLRQAGPNWEAYITAGQRSYRLRGPSPEQLSLDPTGAVLSPTGHTSDPHEGYAGITSVMECGSDLAAVFHAEYHSVPVAPWEDCGAPYHASMAWAASADGGESFTTSNPAWFLTSSGTASYGQPKCAYGAGGGSVFDPGGDYLFLYYYDWDSTQGLYVARACRDDCGSPQAWRKFDGGAFSADASAVDFLQPSAPSIPILPSSPGGFDAFVSVSRNAYLDAYLMVSATESGIGLRASADGVSWGPRVELLSYIDALDVTIPTYYPTLFDAGTWSRDLTSRDLVLVYGLVADDLGQHAAHRAFAANVQLTLTGDAQTASFDRLTLARYYDANQPDHWCTTGTAPGYPHETNLGQLAANSLPGTWPLYDCVLPGNDHTASHYSHCEGGTSLGIMGYVWTTPAPDRTPIYRCWMVANGSTDHFISLDPSCEGQNVEGSLGYVE